MSKINLEQINTILNLEAATDEKILDQLIELYEAQYVELTQKMAESLQNGQILEMAGYAHKLKSSAANIGFQDIEEVCLKIEVEGKKGSQEDYSLFIEAVREGSKIALGELKKILTNKAA